MSANGQSKHIDPEGVARDLLGLPSPPPCRWLICEQGDRWTRTAERFAGQMTVNERPEIVATDVRNCHQQAVAWLDADAPFVLLYGFRQSETLAVMDSILKINSSDPWTWNRRVVSIAACDSLDSTSRLALARCGVSIFLRHPEDLPGFTALIQAHFASFAGGLK